MTHASIPEVADDTIAGEEVAASLGPFGRGLAVACRSLAVVGGLIFVGLVIMSIVSIVGRKLLATSVPGDVEVLEMAAAVAASGFFAYCHMTNSNVRVDFFTANWPPGVLGWLDAAGSFLVGCVGLLLAWRTAAGALSLRQVEQTSAILAWPIWIAQMLMVPGFLLLAAAGYTMVAHHLRRRAP